MADTIEKCGYAKKYKGTRPPKCNNGNPCKACIKKFEQEQAKKND